MAILVASCFRLYSFMILPIITIIKNILMVLMHDWQMFSVFLLKSVVHRLLFYVFYFCLNILCLSVVHHSIKVLYVTGGHEGLFL